MKFSKEHTKENTLVCSPNMHKLSMAEAKESLSTIPGWQLDDAASKISREFVFKGFISGMQFVNEVADLATLKSHHPKIEINYDKVTITFTTHAIDGLSKVDFNVAKQVDDLSLKYQLGQKSHCAYSKL